MLQSAAAMLKMFSPTRGAKGASADHFPSAPEAAHIAEKTMTLTRSLLHLSLFLCRKYSWSCDGGHEYACGASNFHYSGSARVAGGVSVSPARAIGTSRCCCECELDNIVP
jgi:hypothetical protein